MENVSKKNPARLLCTGDIFCDVTELVAWEDNLFQTDGTNASLQGGKTLILLESCSCGDFVLSMFVQYGTRTNTMLHCYLSCFALNTPLLVSRKDVCCILTQRIRQRDGPLGELCLRFYLVLVAQLGHFLQNQLRNSFMFWFLLRIKRTMARGLASPTTIMLQDQILRIANSNRCCLVVQCSMHESCTKQTV